MLTTYPKMNERSLLVRKLQLRESDASDIVIINIPVDTYPSNFTCTFTLSSWFSMMLQDFWIIPVAFETYDKSLFTSI